jgi:hypothetical protein
MSRRNLAAKGKADANQPAIAQAIEAIGYPVMDLSAAGNGVEDLLVGLYRLYERRNHWWLMVECKVPPIRYKPAQLAWRELTQGWPRITVTSAQDAVDQIRELTR